MNRLTSGPLGGYTYGDASHADAATAVGSTWSASYDAAGDMTCRATTSATTCAGSSPTGAPLSYDNEGRLASWQNTPGSSPTQSASYLYDGAGQRVQQAVTASGATTTTSYIGRLEEVTSSGGTTTTTAYYGSLAESVNGALSYLLSDGLGSVSEAVSTAGTVAATQLYGPYGAVRFQSGTLPTDKGYTGQRSDAASTGLDYYNARYYDPVAGQFTSADTTLAGGLNRYAYVAGNPETRTDPTGHIPVQPGGGQSAPFTFQDWQSYTRNQRIANGVYLAPNVVPDSSAADASASTLAAASLVATGQDRVGGAYGTRNVNGRNQSVQAAGDAVIDIYYRRSDGSLELVETLTTGVEYSQGKDNHVEFVLLRGSQYAGAGQGESVDNSLVSQLYRWIHAVDEEHKYDTALLTFDVSIVTGMKTCGSCLSSAQGGDFNAMFGKAVGPNASVRVRTYYIQAGNADVSRLQQTYNSGWRPTGWKYDPMNPAFEDTQPGGGEGE